MSQFPVSCLFVLSVSCGSQSSLSPVVSPLSLGLVSVVVRLVQCQVYMPEVFVSELCFLFYFESPWSSMLCYLVVVSSLCAVCSLFLILATVLLTLYSVPKFLSFVSFVSGVLHSCPHSRLRTQAVLPRRGKGTQQPIKASLLYWAVIKV